MKKNYKIILGIVVLLVVIIAFNFQFSKSILSIIISKFSKPDLIYVKQGLWQHESGFKIGQGDFVSFSISDTTFSLKEDTIYYLSKPRGIVKHTNKHFFEMEVSSLSGEKGIYINTDQNSH